MNKKINVLSLFDGMSGGQIALNKMGIKNYTYYASEIKKHAIKVTQHNYPNTNQLGDVRNIDLEKLPKIDLLIGGSPCQSFSFAGKRKGMSTKDNIEITTLEQYLEVKEDGFEFEGQSYLFWEYVYTLAQLKKKNPEIEFLLENVRMEKEWENVISETLNVQPILIDSVDFSYQTRKRLYWTNIHVEQWSPKKINFQDFKDTDYSYLLRFKLNKTPSRIQMWEGKCPNVTNRGHINCLTTKQDRWSNSGLIEFDGFCRYLTTRELEIAQTVPVGYCKVLSMRQSEDVLGDGWTIDVIVHLLKNSKIHT